MTVEQLIEALQNMPQKAVVLFEGDAGYALVAGLNLEKKHQRITGRSDTVFRYERMILVESRCP